jgi:formylglycine-generating enzyme required for sulfatase activity
MNDTKTPGVFISDLPERITAKDGSEMVLIPAGEFQMGTDATEIPELLSWAKQYYPSIDASWFEKETPRHGVYLDPFYLDVSPVTNAQYRQFVEANGYPEPRYWDDDRFNQSNQPVVGVSWYDAMAYGQWAGKRLPTEAEWEKGARGGLVAQRYPWGNQPANDKRANYGMNVGKTTGVLTYPPNGYGLYDLAGNVWEWCLDEYQEDFYNISPKNNPLAGGNLCDLLNHYTDQKTDRVLSGGCWDWNPVHLRVARRGWGNPANSYCFRGFRCASGCFH